MSPTQERKIGSVLFLGLVDSTPLAGSCDPRDWRAVIARYFSDTRAAVERFGETVEKFILSRD